MYQRLSAVLFPIVTVLFIGTALWGYQEHQEKNRILVKAENQYQRAFHDLSYHMDRLHEELGNTLAVSTKSNFHRKGLVNVWRLTSEAQSEVNQLPLSLMPFHETESLLANIASFSYKTATRDLKEQPLSDSEWKVLKSLYEQSKEIKSDLRKIQQSVLNNRLQWMDVEMLLASGKENFDNDIIDGFQLMNKRVSEYGDIDWGPTAAVMNRRMSAQSLDGPEIAQEDAKRRAAQFFGLKDTANMNVVENGAETDFATFTVTIPQSDHSNLQAEYTKKGGKLVYFLSSRDVQQTRADIGQAVEAAESFLEQHGYKGMRAVTFDEYNHVASLTFARTVDGVIVYPEKLTVKVALDNTEVIGLSAGELLYNKTVEKIDEPSMSESESRKLLNPEFDVQDVSLAIVQNDFNENVLCYEFTGRINGGNYRIYLNAENGSEEKIERIRDADAEAAEQSR